MNPLLEEFRAQNPLVDSEDRRLGHLLGRALEAEGRLPRVVIVGFPSDEGVRRNQGRIGASQAPEKLRRYFYRLTLGQDTSGAFEELIRYTLDLGDIEVDSNLEEAQKSLGECVADYLRHNVILVILGGGHDTSYGHFLGYVQAGIPVEIHNWDAHADVRPLRHGLGHSGSPFRQILTHPSKLCRSYSVIGLLLHSNAMAHIEFVHDHGGATLFSEEVTQETAEERIDLGSGALLLSIDMDVVDQSFAPGVSAPASGGLHQDRILHLAEAAGRSFRVSSLDLVEVNPRVDDQDRTSRLGAIVLWRFLSGLSRRPHS